MLKELKELWDPKVQMGESWVNALNERYRNELDLDKSETIEVSEGNMDEYLPLTKEQLVAKVQELQGEVLELVGHLVETVSDLGELVEATVEPVEPVEPVEDELPVEVELDAVVYRDWETDRKSTRLNSSHSAKSRMPSSA